MSGADVEKMRILQLCLWNQSEKEHVVAGSGRVRSFWLQVGPHNCYVECLLSIPHYVQLQSIPGMSLQRSAGSGDFAHYTVSQRLDLPELAKRENVALTLEGLIKEMVQTITEHLKP